jgi:hypothetical protein
MIRTTSRDDSDGWQIADASAAGHPLPGVPEILHGSP